MKLILKTRELVHGYGGIGVWWDPEGFTVCLWKWGWRFE